MEAKLKLFLKNLDLMIEPMALYQEFWYKEGKLKKMAIPQSFWEFWNGGYKSDIKEYGYLVWKNPSGLFELKKKIPDIVEVEEIEEIEEKPEIFIDENIRNIIENSFLYDYQKQHCLNLIKSLKKNRCYLDSSDTGTGKTFVTLFLCKSLNLIPFIICPKAIIPGWLKSMEKIGIEEFYISNYALLRHGKMLIYEIKTKGKYKGQKRSKKVLNPFISVRKIDFMKEKARKKKPYELKYEIKWEIPFELKNNLLFIYDEGHRCKNRSINSEIMISLADKRAKIGILSATLGESPLKMFGTGKVLGFYNKSYEFYTLFVSSYGCHRGNFGWEFDRKLGKNWMKLIYDKLQKDEKMSRMNVKELIDKGLFPSSKILCECYQMDQAQKISKLIQNMIEDLKEQREISNELKELKEETQKMENVSDEIYSQILTLKEYQDKLLSPIAIRQKYRQMIELAKVKTFVELASDEIESGNSVVILANYIDTIHQLASELKTDCLFYGQNKSEINENNRLRFQNNDSPIIIGNLASMKEGIDLHDEKNERKRISLISPSDSAQDLKQSLGRIQRSGGTYSIQKIIFCNGTIEEIICENLKSKINNLSVLNDGDLSYDFLVQNKN